MDKHIIKSKFIFTKNYTYLLEALFTKGIFMLHPLYPLKPPPHCEVTRESNKTGGNQQLNFVSMIKLLFLLRNTTWKNTWNTSKQMVPKDFFESTYVQMFKCSLSPPLFLSLSLSLSLSLAVVQRKLFYIV